MSTTTIPLQIPFDALLDAVKTLSSSEQQQLLLLLEDELAQAEESLVDADAATHATVQDARTAYAAGDFKTLDEYRQAG